MNSISPPLNSAPNFQTFPRKALIAWAVLVFILSVIPVPSFTPQKFIFLSFDTFAHAVFYVPLGAFCLWTFPWGSRLFMWGRAVCYAVAFGLMVELIQRLIPWRSFELTDLVADGVGASSGATLALFFPRLYQFKFSR